MPLRYAATPALALIVIYKQVSSCLTEALSSGEYDGLLVQRCRGPILWLGKISWVVISLFPRLGLGLGLGLAGSCDLFGLGLVISSQLQKALRRFASVGVMPYWRTV